MYVVLMELQRRNRGNLTFHRSFCDYFFAGFLFKLNRNTMGESINQEHKETHQQHNT